MSADIRPSAHFEAAAKVAPKADANRSVEAVREKQQRVTDHAKEHFANNRSRWITAQYGKLLRSDAPAPAMRPAGMGNDRKETLWRAASHLVDRRQSQRIVRISASAERMISGKVHEGLGR